MKKEFTYEYDKNGNLTKDDINGYFYDYKNRLVKVIQNEVIKVDELGNIIETIPEEEIVSFEYDVLNRRIEKKIQEKTINYIYAGQNAIKEIVTDNTTNTVIETRQNIYSNNLDDILSTIITDEISNTTEQYYYEKNHLGSITKITDEQGLVVEQYEYDVFGVAYVSVNNVDAISEVPGHSKLSIKKAGGSETDLSGDSEEITIDNIRYKRYNGQGKIGNTRLYTGREYDAELKLYYNRARYYSPDLGRFISRDPIDISDDVNLYSYVGNNGVNYTDPSGKAKKFVDAYDRYNSLKKEIYGVLPGSFDLDFVKLSSDEQQQALLDLNEARNYARELHYARNQFNVGEGFTIVQAKDNLWKKLPNNKSALHQIDVPKDEWNEKWISNDGKQEAVFHYETLEIILDETNIGTYNFYNPNDWIGHIKYDVNPYEEWGNGWNDTSTLEQRSAWTRQGVINATK